MPKQEQSITELNKLIWNTIEKHTGQPSAARIPQGPEQLQEINRRLDSLTKDFAAIGAAITPTAIQATLSLDDDTFNRWKQGKATVKDKDGHKETVALDKCNLGEAEKQYIIDRAEIIKNYLQKGELVATTAAQAKDNRENGGALFVLQNVYGIGQEKGKDQITVSLEDLLKAAAAIKERGPV